MTVEQLRQAALTFLRRTTLSGEEVPMFIEVMNWLNEASFHQKPQADTGKIVNPSSP